MAVKYLSDLHPDLQAEVLKNHPEFHSYGLQQQIDTLRKTVHNANKRKNTEAKQERQVKAAVEAVQAKRAAAKSVDEPQKIEAEPSEAPQPRAPRQSAKKDVAGFSPLSQITNVLQQSRFALNRETPRYAPPSIHQLAMSDIAGQMMDHINRNPEVRSNDIMDHLAKFQDSLGLHAYSHDLAERTGWSSPRVSNAAKVHIKEAHQHLAAAANIFHNRFKDFSSGGVSFGDQSAVIANDYIAEHAGTVRSKEGSVDASNMSQDQLRQGLLTGKLKDESSEEGSKKFAARMRNSRFWKDQAAIRVARDTAKAEQTLQEINKSDNKQKKSVSDPLKDVKARRGDDGTRFINEALGKRRLHLQKVLGTTIAPVSSDLPGRTLGKFEPEPKKVTAEPVVARPTATPTRKQIKKRKSAKTAARKSELVQHSATAIRALVAGVAVPKESAAVIATKPGLMDALNKEATKRQISRAGHTAAFDAARGAEVPEQED